MRSDKGVAGPQAMRGLGACLHWLSRTPLHPQWFVRNDQRSRLAHLNRVAGRVLDVGCSDRALARHLPAGCEYVGLDHFATVQAFYATRPDVYGDACQLPIQDRCVDGVLLFEVLEHVPEPTRALAECARILRAQGILLLSVPFLYPIHNAPYDFHRFTRFALQRELEAQGFRVESIAPRLRALEAGGLAMSLALGDAALGIWRHHRWALLALPVLGVLVLLVNVTAWLLARVLPGSDFMPGGYQVVAVREP